jgi:hypothetical protein
MVKLPKEVADAIHYFQTKGKEKILFNVPGLASFSTKDKRYKVINDYIQVSDGNFKNYFKALVDGYEVEMTKEDRLKQYYYVCRKEHPNTAFGILRALEYLEIEIEGVNK